MQFAQLLFIHQRWRLGQQALGALGFGEGDHVADRLGTGHQGDDAVQAKRDAAMRWRAVLQGVQQKAKLDAPSKSETSKKVTNNAIFVGSTSELNKLIKNMSKGE